MWWQYTNKATKTPTQFVHRVMTQCAWRPRRSLGFNLWTGSMPKCTGETKASYPSRIAAFWKRFVKRPRKNQFFHLWVSHARFVCPLRKDVTPKWRAHCSLQAQSNGKKCEPKPRAQDHDAENESVASFHPLPSCNIQYFMDRYRSAKNKWDKPIA